MPLAIILSVEPARIGRRTAFSRLPEPRRFVSLDVFVVAPQAALANGAEV